MITLEDKKLHASQLLQLYHFYDERNEGVYKNQIVDYAEKYKYSSLHICFCGHFSAGKSTLINRIMGKPLLPQSPIPTSANIVEIKNGQEKVIVHFSKQEPMQFSKLPEMDTLHTLCQDGEEVNRIEIFQTITEMDNHVTLMDTPGIDAADDADRLMTESALHKVDLFVYVMDYNHVQSEVNALFLKQLEERKKPYIIVINQVDKHNEEELSFKSFRQSIVDVFKGWNIHPTAYFFTSMLSEDVPVNEFGELQEELFSFSELYQGPAFFSSIYQSIQYTIAQSIAKKEREILRDQETYRRKLEQLAVDEQVSIADVEEHLATLQEKMKELDNRYEETILPTIKNAQIMTFEHRERAGHFVESMQPSFKVGFFSSKKRTEMERSTRLEQFYNGLKTAVSEQMEWKLREKVTSFISELYPISVKDQLFAELVTKENIKNLIDSSAIFSNQSILVYADKLSSFIRKQYRRYFLDLWDQVRDQAMQPLKNELHKLSEKKNQLLEIEKLENKIAALDQSLIDYQNRIYSMMETVQPDVVEEKILDEILNNKNKLEVAENFEFANQEKTEDEIMQNSTRLMPTKIGMLSYQRTLKDADQAISLLENVPTLSTLIEELSSKKQRLQHRNYTVALFGAFSAGKSSFANLLIGEQILPVSPNPTTAAINKISPPFGKNQHGDVSVKIKTEESLIKDIEYITNTTFSSIDECYQWLRKADVDQLSLEELHLSFIHAFLTGYVKMKERIGSSYRISLEEFQAYVQQEEKACFVQEIELFYDCELTRKNITLVDTPGADSVNARHTELAFSYIKDADAILFVTYYNHPFSKPDQQFLERLGSVKDAFQMDKMFFMINAIDLAKDDNEIKLVKGYIQKELQTFHIDEPRLYPVSSKMAFQSKQKGIKDPHLQRFEADFHHFIQEDLTQIAMQAVYHDIHRAFSYLDHLLEILNSDEQTRQQQLQQWNIQEDSLYELNKQLNDEAYKARILQRLQKQEHFMKQRFRIQFGDLFKTVIHPGSISSNGRAGRSELKKALQQLLHLINDRLNYEMEALHIRMEQEMNESRLQMKDALNQEVQQVVNEFQFSPKELSTIQAGKQFVHEVELEEQEQSKFTQLFKDTKSFFAKGGRDELHDGLYSLLVPMWEETVDSIFSHLQMHYQKEWNRIVFEWEEERRLEIHHYFDLLRKGLEVDPSEKVQLIKIHQSLERLVLTGKGVSRNE